MTDIKSYFHEWCAKTKVDPKFEVRPTGEYFISIFIAFYLSNKNFATIHMYIYISGPKHRQRFLCEVRIPQYPYVAVGNSTNKKDAERNAARDFIKFLVRTGKIKPRDG